MRCFVAIELPTAAVLALTQAGRAICDLEPGWTTEKWAAPEVMHVTLKFLGEVDVGTAELLASEFSAASADLAPFPLAFGSLRALPRLARASMIWAGAEDPSGRCAALAGILDEIAARHAVRIESRTYAAHVTLVRARHPRPVAPTTLGEAGYRSGLAGINPVSVLSATLFSSTLTPRGPIHERLAEFALGMG